MNTGTTFVQFLLFWHVLPGVKPVLRDLQKFVTKENEISSLTTLNEIISSSQEEMEFLYNSDGIDLIVSLLESDSKLENICVKILANASRRHEKVRSKLLQNNIFQLLTVKLKSETHFPNSNLIFYSALIVILLQENYEAQNQMRTSGCLSSVLHILCRILDDADSKPLPSKATELITYAITASFREPKHIESQTEVGWITPKILQYLEKQPIFSGSKHLQIIKCFWFFLNTALDRNELNQQIFLNSSGLSILFRSIQTIAEEENCEEMGDILVKLTGVLVKFRSNKEFLDQASNYCPVMILSSLLKTSNILVVQRTIVFLDSLTREFPKAIQVMKDNKILRRIKKAKILLLKGKPPREFSQNLCNCRKSFDQTQTSHTEQCLSCILQFGLNLKSENETFREDPSELSLQSYFCVVHDPDLKFHGDLKYPIKPAMEGVKSEERVKTPSRFWRTNLIVRRKELRERERKFKKLMSQNLHNSTKRKVNHFNIVGVVKRRVMQTLQIFLSFFFSYESDRFNSKLPQ